MQQEHAAVPQSRPLALARGEVPGNVVRPRMREVPPPRRDGDLHTLNRDDLWLATWHCAVLEHDPEKWKPVFRKDRAPPKRFEHQSIQPETIALRAPDSRTVINNGNLSAFFWMSAVRSAGSFLRPADAAGKA
jgi:hypothetical protein